MVFELTEGNADFPFITSDYHLTIQPAGEDFSKGIGTGGYILQDFEPGVRAHPREDYTRQLLSVRRTRRDQLAAPGEDAVLQCSGVTAGYRTGMNVIAGIDFTIQRGRTVAVVGESGSGKSTLARVITGLLPPSAGQLRFDHQVLPAFYKDRSRDLLRRLQMIYQMPDVALNPRQKVREVIGRPLSFYFGMKRTQRELRIAELLDMIDLPADFAGRYTTELSGGQKQRICIARALAAEPDVIICDEVTSALDQLVAEEILQLLQRLQADLSVSYLFITHDLAGQSDCRRHHRHVSGANRGAGGER